MYCGADFSYSAPEEARDFTLDFSQDLGPGEKISSAIWLCEVVSGTDAGAAGRLVGGPATGDSVLFDLVGVTTTQRVAGLLDGVKYRLTARVTTDRTQILELYSHVACKTRN